MNVMERSNAYADPLLAQGLCNGIPEQLLFYLGPVKPPQLLTLTYISGCLHYSATWPISTAESVITQKRKRDNANTMPDGKAQQKKCKQAKGKGVKSKKKEISRAQSLATARFNKKRKQSKNDKRVAALFTSPTQESAASKHREREDSGNVESYFRN